MSSFACSRSIAMIGSAPASAAPMITDSPTPPQPITRDRRARLDAGGVDDGADAGGDAAADQAGDVERHARPGSARPRWPAPRRARRTCPIDRYWCTGPSGDARAASCRRAATLSSAWLPGADPLLAVPALAAGAARVPPRQHHVVAGRDVRRRRRRPPRPRRRPRGRARSGTAPTTRRRRRAGRSGRRRSRRSAPAPRWGPGGASSTSVIAEVLVRAVEDGGADGRHGADRSRSPARDPRGSARNS